MCVQVLLAPGDTFRAAAAERLAAWAKRCGAQMGTFKEGGRPGGVLAAACNDAKQRKDVDVVICDTGARKWCLDTFGSFCTDLFGRICVKETGNAAAAGAVGALQSVPGLSDTA